MLAADDVLRDEGEEQSVRKRLTYLSAILAAAAVLAVAAVLLAGGTGASGTAVAAKAGDEGPRAILEKAMAADADVASATAEFEVTLTADLDPDAHPLLKNCPEWILDSVLQARRSRARGGVGTPENRAFPGRGGASLPVMGREGFVRFWTNPEDQYRSPASARR